MHTTPETPNPDLLALRDQLKLERLRYRLTMLRVQTKALKTLERLMDEPEPSGNEKVDKAKATERNRQRLAANQTLIHCRTAQREKRLSKVGGMAMQRMAMQGAESSPNPEDMAMPPDPSDNSTACTTPHGLRPTDRRTQTMPPKKFLKPKHPRRSRKRKTRR